MLIISLKNLPHKEQHDFAHRMLKTCLNTYGIDYNINTEIIKGEYGKPSLAAFPNVHYNLSHADGIIACCSGDTECGIDAEKIRAYRPNVLKRAFSKTETALIEAASENQKDQLFFRLWTLKESYVKAIGIGISYPLNSIEFEFNGNEIITNIKGYSFRQYIIDEAFIVSVCEKNKDEDI